MNRIIKYFNIIVMIICCFVKCTNKGYDYYCLSNNIYGCTSPNKDTTKRIFDAKSYIENLYIGEYSGWNYDPSDSFSVSNIYGNDIEEQDEYSVPLSDGKINAKNTKKYIGCGPIALYGQLDYLSKNAGYTNLNCININTRKTTNDPNLDNSNYKTIMDEYATNLATNVIKSVPTYEVHNGEIIGWFGKLFTGKDVEGTLTLPKHYINAANNLLKDCGYINSEIRMGYDDTYGIYMPIEYYDWNNSMIKCYGDELPRESNDFEKTKREIISSINKGMPVTIWTLGGMGDYSWHYMNIYGYSTYKAYNKNGQYMKKYLFKIRMNWGKKCVEYVDPDILNCIGSYGLIFFKELKTKKTILPSDYGFNCNYNNTVKESIVNNVQISSLRTGYVKHYDSSNNINDFNLLVLSSKSKNSDEAYIEYKTNNSVDSIYFDGSVWGKNEGINIIYCSIKMQYKKGNEWVDALDLLDRYSSDITNPLKYKYSFNEEVNEIRIFNKSIKSGNSNKCRYVLGAITFFFK